MNREILPLLPILTAVADTGQVTAAAELLGVPQPTITRALQRAERILGTPVHTKDGRGIRLTPAAEALIPYARAALDSVEAGWAAAGAIASPVHGRVGIAFQNILGEDLIPALLRVFSAEHPGVEFALSQGARAHCLALLSDGTADVAFVSPPPAAGEVPGPAPEITGLSPDELVVVVPADHRLAHRRTIRLPELADEQLILMAPGFGLRGAVRELLRASGVRARIAFEGQDIHTLVGLVSAGLGVTIVPRRDYPTSVRVLRIAGVRAERYVVMVALAATASAPVRPAVAAFRKLVATRGAGIAAAMYAAPRGS